MTAKSMLQLGEVSRRLGLNPQTLYFHERIGLIPPPQRTEAGYRLFSQSDVERLDFITRGVIFLAIAYSCWQWSITHAIGVIIFLVFFDIKARQEESWLSNKFSDYDAYRSQVKKLIPWLY